MLRNRVALVIGRVEEKTGAPRRLMLLASLLVRHDFEVIVVGNDSEVLRQLSSTYNVPLKTMPFKKYTIHRASGPQGALYKVYGIVGDLTHALIQNIKFFCWVRKMSIGIIVARGSRNILSCALLAKILDKKLSLVWDIGYEPESIGLVLKLHKVCFSLANSVVAQNEGCLSGIEDLHPEAGDKITTILPAIDSSFLKKYSVIHSKKMPSPLRVSLLQVGTICDRKNQLFSIQVLRELMLLLPEYDIRLVFVGGEGRDAEYTSTLINKVSRHDLQSSVDLIGWSDVVDEYMLKADFLLMPSKNEGVSNTIQEAMVLGLPVVATDVGGVSALVCDGVSGVVIKDMDASLWAGRIVNLVNNPGLYSALSTSAQEVARGEFSEESWAGRYVQVLEQSIV